MLCVLAEWEIINIGAIHVSEFSEGDSGEVLIEENWVFKAYKRGREKNC